MVVGEHVSLAASPEIVGTISGMNATSVRVTWRQWERGKPRMRIWYDREAAMKALRPYPQ